MLTDPTGTGKGWLAAPSLISQAAPALFGQHPSDALHQYLGLAQARPYLLAAQWHLSFIYSRCVCTCEQDAAKTRLRNKALKCSCNLQTTTTFLHAHCANMPRQCYYCQILPREVCSNSKCNYCVHIVRPLYSIGCTGLSGHQIMWLSHAILIGGWSCIVHSFYHRPSQKYVFL